MKVYVVYRGAYNDRTVHGVFSSMEKALAYVAPIQQEWESGLETQRRLVAEMDSLITSGAAHECNRRYFVGPDFEIWECDLDGDDLTDVTPDWRPLPL